MFITCFLKDFLVSATCWAFKCFFKCVAEDLKKVNSSMYVLFYVETNRKQRLRSQILWLLVFTVTAILGEGR